MTTTNNFSKNALNNASLILLPFHQDILQTLSQHIIQSQRDVLPDLSQVIVLLSNTHAVTALRTQLLDTALQHGVNALLGPHITSFQGWLEQQPLASARIISDQARELMLVEALLEYPHLYRDSNPWLLASNLIELFDDLTRQHICLPDKLELFIQQLGEAYGLPNASHTALGLEATLVHTLWRAMQQQLQAINTIDPHSAHILRLAQSLQTLKPEQHVYVVGLYEFSPAEIQWLNTLLARKQLTLITQGNPDESASNLTPSTTLSTQQAWQLQIDGKFHVVDENNAAGDFFQRCFAYEAQPLKQRAQAFAIEHSHSPVQESLHVFTAANAEEEARAIDIQIRQWLLQGKRHIAVISENRRLARRLRALLERAGIVLQDTAGWALSTTSAATVIERWLENLEQDFHYQTLLDFLKSPFICLAADKEQHLTAVYRLEQGVVLYENVASNLQRYRKHTEYRLKRLSAAETGYYDGVLNLLDEVQNAANIMQPLLTGRHQPQDYLQALQQSLTLLQAWSSLVEDEAGQRIQELLQQLEMATHYSNMTMDWAGFRTWLGANLERCTFKPTIARQQVQLLTLTQSDLQHYDAVIIAAAEQEYLPGKPNLSPFFNDGVRARLGITTRQQQLAVPFRHFRRLLECPPVYSITAPSEIDNVKAILITRRHAEHDEEIIASPWLAALQTFHQLSFGHDLQDVSLALLVNDSRTEIRRQEKSLPSPMTSIAATAVPSALLPTTISASAYQQLMDCPYQFFAARCLQLKAPEKVREQLQKDDFGNRVHTCLEAFHTNVPDLPGPFKELISDQNRDAAIAMLNRISEQVFSQDIEDNFLHRGWLKHWLNLVPAYIHWQQRRNQDWQPAQSELELRDIPISEHLVLRGILDRIDTRADTHGDISKSSQAIIDYKTGFIPKQNDIDNGEAVQLPYYALLASHGLDSHAKVQRVEYVSLSNDKVGTHGFLEDERLHDLTHDVGQRLQVIMDELHQGHAVNAWGDANACRYCTMSGLCRLGMQQQADSGEIE